MTALLQDLRYATRTLRRSPGFGLVVVLTLALGIGVNSGMFSLVNAVLFRPLPGPHPDRLVFLERQSAKGDAQITMSFPDFRDYRANRDVFAELAALSLLPASVGRGDAASVRISQIVTGNYFQTFGTSAHIGRLLTDADDETPGGHPVVVLSHPYWKVAFQSDPHAVGQSLLIGGKPFTIVGVAPPGFSGAFAAATPDFWVPMMMLDQVQPDMAGALEQREACWLQLLGRLRPDVTPEQAQARLDVVAPQVIAKHKGTEEYDRALLVKAAGAVPLTPEWRRTALAVSTLILAMVGLVLLITCANVANILLARASSRRKEISIRLALGASRWRIVRQLLAESLLLALLGGGAGVLLATWALEGAVRLLPNLPFNVAIGIDVRPDARVLLVTLGVSVVTGILFGLLPALHATRLDVAPTLKEGAAGSGGTGRPTNRLRNALVIAQVAVSCVLLICAGLFVRSLQKAQAVDPGFEHKSVLSVMLELGGRAYEPARKAALLAQLVERARELPGVRSASAEDYPALGPGMSTRGYWLPDVTGVAPNDAFFELGNSVVTPGHFDNLDIALLRGRDFDIHDTRDSPGVAIVNQAFVDRFWPGQDPLGKRISTTGPGGPFLEIVAVTETIKYRLPGEPPRPYVYLPLAQWRDVATCVLLVRAKGDPLAHLAGIRQILRELDPDLVPASTGGLTEFISYVMLPAKLAAGLFGLFGLLALGLASIGLYGVMAYVTARRMHEIGVRIALGAQHRTIVGLVMTRCLLLTLAGTLAGLILAVAATRWVSALLYEVSPTDPATFVGVALVLATVALLAGYFPARRATRIDPVVALRCE